MTPRRPVRRGSLYISVVGAAMLISIAGLTAMHVARIELRSSVADGNASAARLGADAAVSLALSEIDARDNWRTHFTAGVLEPSDPAEIGGAEVQFVLDAGVDADDNPLPLDDPSATTITLRGIGRAGGAVSVSEVTLIGSETGLDSLDASIAARGDIVIGRRGLLSIEENLRVDHAVFAGADISRNDDQSDIVGDAIAVGSITANVTGTALEGQPGRRFPDPENVFDYYKQRGAWIDIDQVPQSGGRHFISDEAIGPGRNPFGEALNAEGIYVIDCLGREIRIEDSRILGTLVLLNNATESRVDERVNWQPVVANFPALMAQNGMEFHYDSTFSLNERNNINLNPPGVPDNNGVENNTDDDSYASEINGLVYVAGELVIENAFFTRINGVVVCGGLRTQNTVRVNYSDVFFSSPPPGFGSLSDAAISIGSWRRGQN